MRWVSLVYRHVTRVDSTGAPREEQPDDRRDGADGTHELRDEETPELRERSGMPLVNRSPAWGKRN